MKMTTPFWCLLAASVIPFLLGFVSYYFRYKQFGSIDNKYPRLQQAQLAGAGARAQAAEENAFEALPVFAGAVFVAHLAGASAGTAAVLSVIFVVARVLHAIAYLTNIDPLRTLVFLVGLGCSIGLFVISA
jgi:uncharacterized MAPEG superfamily protein